MKTYLFVMNSQSGYIKPLARCQAQNEQEAINYFDACNLHICMNCSIICVNDIPETLASYAPGYDQSWDNHCQ